jgi:hypothetical protein
MVTTSVRGVFYKPDYNKTKPYYFETMVNGTRKCSWFPTLEAAAKAKTAKESAKLAPAIAKKRTLKEKRERDVQKSGNTSKLERDAAIELKTCADATYGPGTAIVMNDGTLADVLFKVAEALLYLQLQLKTTATKKKNENGYRFRHVLGYAGMLVVCWVVELKKAWVFDGTWLDKRGQENLNFTPGSETHALATALTMDQLIAYLHDPTHAEHLRLTTEDAARNDFKGKNNKQEKFGIDAYMTFKPGTHDWPREQGGEYDTTLKDEDDKTLRVQHKSCYPKVNTAGLYCPHLGKHDGKDLDGNRLYTCYDKDDADLYVFHYHHEPTNTSHFWEIPSKALAEHGYFTKTTKKESILLYGCPVAKQPNPDAKKKADTWTSAFYTGELKHK